MRFATATANRMRRRRVLDQDTRDNRHLREVMARELAPTSCCVDVGAHEGVILRDMLAVAPSGAHVAFEPLPDFAELLRSRYPNVDVRQAAVGDEPGVVAFNWILDAPAMSSVLVDRTYPDPTHPHPVTSRLIMVERVTLDAALPRGYVPALIKVDVEGVAHEVLRGAQATIEQHRPLLAVEFGRHSAPYTGFDSDAMYQLVMQLGYRIFDFDGRGPYDRSQFEAANVWNFLLRPV